MKKYWLGATAGYGLLILTAPCANADGARLEEVIVTAQKQEENIQAVPIAISALTAEQLEAKGITSYDGVAQNTPSVTFAPYPISASTLVLYMRGQGEPVPNAINSEGSVGLYEDGFYIARATAATFDLADVERVEVLRGPQGTLYGRNTTGGAVNLISRAPTGEFGFRQTLTFGTRNQFRSLTTVNLPEVWNVATKFTLLKSDIDGYIKNSGSGHDFGEEKQQAGRFSLHWNAAENFTADYFFEYGDVYSTPPYNQDPSLNGTVIPGIAEPYYANPNGPNSHTYRPVDLDLSKATFQMNGLTLSWDVSDNFSIKSLTSYRELDSTSYSDLLEAFPIAPGVPFRSSGAETNAQHQFSQELQFAGSSPHGAISYVAGLYYFDESGRGSSDSYYAGYGISTQSHVDADASSSAAFGQITWAATDALELTLGGRYTRDRRSMERFGAFENGSATGDSASKKFNSFNPAAIVNYHWSDTLTTYAKVATGYRSGGLYAGAPFKRFDQAGFDPEKVTSYELGLKSNLFDHRVRFNVAAFESRYRDFQTFVQVDPGDTTRALIYNVGEAKIRGLETELVVAPLADLTVSLDYTYLDADFTQVDVVPGSIYDGAANPLSPYRVGDNIKGLFTIPYAPRHSFNLGIDYIVAHFDSSELSANFNYRWQAKVYPNAVGGPDVPGREFDVQPSYGIAGARLSWSFDLPRGDRAKLSLWGKNIFNKDYRQWVGPNGTAGVAVQSPTTSLVTPAGYFSRTESWAPPPSYGVDISYEY